MMMRSVVLGAAFAVLAAGTSFAQGKVESPNQNMKSSQAYDSMVAGNAGFRKQRMEKECGPITDAELKASCMSSFGQGDEASKASGKPMKKRRVKKTETKPM